jgi:hypothetical protein
MTGRTQQRAATGSARRRKPLPCRQRRRSHRRRHSSTRSQAAQPDLVDRIFDYVVKLVPGIANSEIRNQGALRDEFGAQEGYIRRRERTPDETARLVLSMFNGRNKHEVSRALDISIASVHRIIKQAGTTAGREKNCRKFP